VFSNECATQIWQYINGVESLKGRDVTLSVKIDGVTYFKTDRVPATITENMYRISTLTTVSDAYVLLSTVRDSAGEALLRTIYGQGVGTTHTVEYIKLEYGDAATPFVRGNPMIALLRCQRYLHVITNFSGNPLIGEGFFFSPHQGIAKIDIPPHMRKVSPTVTFPSVANLQICAGGTLVAPTEIAYLGENTDASFNAYFAIPTGYNCLNEACILMMSPGVVGDKIIVSKEI
jgi:hypothetical protein